PLRTRSVTRGPSRESRPPRLADWPASSPSTSATTDLNADERGSQVIAGPRRFALSADGRQSDLQAAEREREWERAGVAGAVHPAEKHLGARVIAVVECQRRFEGPGVPAAVFRSHDLDGLAPIRKVRRRRLRAAPPQACFGRGRAAFDPDARKHG